MREVMEYELETKKNLLSKLQDYFRTDIKDIDSPKYEDNAINALLEMKKVKTEIEQLEYYLQLKTWFYLEGKLLVECNRDCSKCKQLNGRTDDKGYLFGYECMKYGDSVFMEQFGDTKVFKTEKDYEEL